MAKMTAWKTYGHGNNTDINEQLADLENNSYANMTELVHSGFGNDSYSNINELRESFTNLTENTYEGSPHTKTYCDMDVEGKYHGGIAMIGWILFTKLSAPTLGIVLLYIVLVIKVCRHQRMDNYHQTTSIKHKTWVSQQP